MAPNPFAEALQAFARTPGRFPLVRREPRILFDDQHAVLLLAAGRPARDMPADTASGLREAARFFVRVVLLRPGADHATVLGLPARFSADQLREHYRLLIRLTHPDFQEVADAWPPDAAARVNLAYESLSGGKGEASAPPPAAPQAKVRTGTHRPPPGRRPASRSLAARWRIGLTGLIAACLTVLLALLWQTPQDPSLTLRNGTPAPVAEPVAGMDDSDFDAVSSSFVLNTQPPKPQAANATRAPPAQPLPVERPAQSANEGGRPQRPVVAVAVPEPATRAPVPSPRAMPLEPTDGPADGMLALAMDRTLAVEPAREQIMALDMGSVRPVLTDLLHMLETGQSERLHRWAASQIRQEEAAARFARAYGRTLAGAEVAGLGQAQFDLREADGQPVVHGKVQIRLRQSDGDSTVLRDFRLRAHFRQQDGSMVLTRLDAE